MSESSQYIIVDDTTKHVFEEFEQQISKLFRESIQNAVEDNLARTLRDILTSVKKSESLSRETAEMFSALLPNYTKAIMTAVNMLQNSLDKSLDSNREAITNELIDCIKASKPDLESSEKRIIDEFSLKMNSVLAALENSKSAQKTQLDMLESIIDQLEKNQEKQDKIVEYLQLPWYKRWFTTID